MSYTDTQDLGAGWAGQEKLEADEHRNNPTNVRIREATAHKEAGNAAFAREEYDSAVAAYCDGASAAAEVEGNYRSAVAKELQTACFTNAAQARIKQQRWSDASELCTRALVVDAKCVKVRARGRALVGVGAGTRATRGAGSDRATAVPRVPSTRRCEASWPSAAAWWW